MTAQVIALEMKLPAGVARAETIQVAWDQGALPCAPRRDAGKLQPACLPFIPLVEFGGSAAWASISDPAVAILLILEIGLFCCDVRGFLAYTCRSSDP
jgi:hypothetical protein